MCQVRTFTDKKKKKNNPIEKSIPLTHKYTSAQITAGKKQRKLKQKTNQKSMWH